MSNTKWLTGKGKKKAGPPKGTSFTILLSFELILIHALAFYKCRCFLTSCAAGSRWYVVS